MNVIESFSLDGKVAVVTGGAGHLGSAITTALYEAGAVVYVLSRNNVSFDNCHFDSRRVHHVVGDVFSSESIKKCFEVVYQAESHIDILVNCASNQKGGGRLPEEITDEMWSQTAEGVVGSTFKCIREVIPYMERAGGGKIINVSSMYGVISPDLSMYDGECGRFLNPVNYGTFKAGVIQLTKYFGAYLIERKINVNCITPGTFPSENVQENKEFVKRLCSKNPAHRLGHADDLKGITVLLASQASDYIVGQNIIIDGGWTIW